MLKPRIASLGHEEVFLQRYERLRSWALHLVQNDRQRAEDLLHDVFLQFKLSHPDLKTIESVDAYLRTMLRNMHLSQLRRAARTPEAARPLVDFDSAVAGLETLRQQTKSQAWDELGRICEYSILRKDSSKAASVLILRFFHGYYPVEIAQVLRKSRGAVDQALRNARTEAKAYLADPNSLAFITDKPKKELLLPPTPDDAEDLVLALRDLIFGSTTGPCVTRRELEALWNSKRGERVDCHTLAHIVSCATCLDIMNDCLGLPLLSARHPMRSLGKDMSKEQPSKKGPGGGAPSGGSGAGGGEVESFANSNRKRLKEVLEHRPQELRVSVNGFIVGAHSVASELSKQALSINVEERISFVEVFSERDVRLLFSIIEPPPDGPGAHRERVELSDGRALELSLDFADSRPQIQVAYYDPTYRQESAAQTDEAVTDIGTYGSRVATPLRSHGPGAWLPSAVKSLRALLLGSGLWLRPGTVTALVAVVLVAALLLVKIHRAPAPPVSASVLLSESAVAEEAIAARTDQVVHRTISMEEKKLTGELIARRKLEVWQSREKGVTARRLYDERGSLITGDWRRADGVQTLYAHGRRPQLQLTPEKRGANGLLAFDSVWQLSPSAKEFTELVARADEMHLEEQPTSYVISYSRQASDAPGLVHATLVLRRADLHPTAQSLIIQQGNEQREFRFIETSYERRPANTVSPAVFEPDAELLSSSRLETRTSELETRTSKPETGGAPIPVLATPELEVEVLGLLHQAGADLGEQITAARTREGELKVQGLVDTDKRKAELFAALSSVAKNPAVRIQISTVAEATAAAEKQARRNQSRDPSLGAVTVQQVEAVKDAMPAAAELRRYFGGDDEQARRFASRMINRSHDAMRHAGALKRLLSQFSTQDLRALNPEARGKWLALVRAHANAFQAETAALRQELQPIFFPSAPQTATESATITNDAELTRAVVRLFELGSANDETVRTAFSISAGRPSRSALITSNFWGLLNSSENLAAAIQKSR